VHVQHQHVVRSHRNRRPARVHGLPRLGRVALRRRPGRCPSCRHRVYGEYGVMTEPATIDVEYHGPLLADGHRATDVRNAQRFGQAAAGQARYCLQWERWIIFDGQRWIVDRRDALVGEIAKRVAKRLRFVAATTDGLSRDDRDALWDWAQHCEKASTIRNMTG